MAEENPFAPVFMNPNASKTGLWDLRMMSAANRMETPFERGSRGMYAHQGMRGDPMLAGLAGSTGEPDYSQFTFDPAANAAATKAMAPYGLAPLEASQVKQNMILPNTGFFGNHPRLSGALEGGIFGALASHGGETPGESIQGALEGLVGGQRIKQGLYRQQFARPFEAAGMMEHLEDLQQRRELYGAQMKNYETEAEIQKARIQQARDRDAMHLEEKQIERPVPVEGGTYLYSKGEAPWKGIPYAPNKGPAEGTPEGWHFEAGPGRGKGQEGDLDMLTREQLRAYGIKPEEATPAQIRDANARAQAQRVATIGGGAGARNAAGVPYRNLDEARKDHEGKISKLQTQLYKSDDPKVQKQVMDMLQEQQDNDYTNRLLSGEKGVTLPKRVSAQDAAEWIRQNNAYIQGQIDSENDSFKTNYPQAQALPPEAGGKISSPKTGSASKKIGTYNMVTGQVEYN